MDNQISLQKIKDLLELSQKLPEIVRLQTQCQEIMRRERNEISEKVINDAFDAFGIIVKEISHTPEEELKLQKLCFKSFFCDIVRGHGAKIGD